MEKRKILISDINNFLGKAITQHNSDGTVDKEMYLMLLKRVNEINENDFESLDAYNYFIKFTFEPDRRMKRSLVEKAFDGNFLAGSPFLSLTIDLTGIANWLDK